MATASEAGPVERRFMRDAMRAPLLNVEREQALARRWRDDGDDEALQELTGACMRLVIAMAAKFRRYGLPMADLVQEGAVGLMQVMPATAARFGVAADRTASIEKKLADPRTNLNTGSRYLRYLFNLFPGQLELVLAAYNAGEAAVQRAGNAIPNYRETQNYVKTVMQLYRLLKPVAPAAAVVPAQPPREEPPRLAAPPAPEIRGGALNRGNMMPSLGGPLQLQLPLPPALSKTP